MLFLYPKGGISDKPAGRYKLITLLFPTHYSEEKRRFLPRNYVISALDYTIRCFLFFRFNQARFKFFGKGLPFHLSQWELVKGQFFNWFFENTPPKTLSHFKQVKGQKFFKKRVSISSLPVGTSERINFFGVFSRRAQILGVHFDPLCPNEWGEILFLVSKTPDNFSFPSPNKWRDIVSRHLLTTEWPSDWDMTLRWYEQGNAA